MFNWHVSPTEKLAGSVRPPSSKSQSLRALLFASLASSPSQLSKVLDSPDAHAMRMACSKLGSHYETVSGCYRVDPIENLFSSSDTLVIDAGNSGIVWRFIAAITSCRPGLSLMTGDASVLFRRPMVALKEALEQAGVSIWATHPQGGPYIIKGPWKPANKCRVLNLDGTDSQPVSALLIASSLQEESVELHVRNPQEIPWAMLTVKWLRDRGVSVDAYEINHQLAGTYYRVQPRRWPGSFYCAPSDFSSAAFMIAAALVTASCISIEGLMPQDPQPDKVFIDELVKSGASIWWQGDTLHVDGRHPFDGLDIDLSGPIDLLPVAAVLGCYGRSQTHLKSINGARYKESDRVQAITSELVKMGATIEINESSMVIYPCRLHGAKLSSCCDHRIAMALAVAALGASSACEITDIGWVAKSYPGFAEDLRSLGGCIRAVEA